MVISLWGAMNSSDSAEHRVGSRHGSATESLQDVGGIHPKFARRTLADIPGRSGKLMALTGTFEDLQICLF